MDGLWTEARGQQKQSNDLRNKPAHPQYANYWAPLTRKQHTMPHPAQPRHTNHWAPRTRKRHQQEHRPQRPIESSDPTQHAKGRTGDCPGPRKETATRRNVTQGGGGASGSGTAGVEREAAERLQKCVPGGVCRVVLPPALARVRVLGRRGSALDARRRGGRTGGGGGGARNGHWNGIIRRNRSVPNDAAVFEGPKPLFWASCLALLACTFPLCRAASRT